MLRTFKRGREKPGTSVDNWCLSTEETFHRHTYRFFGEPGLTFEDGRGYLTILRMNQFIKVFRELQV